MTPAQRLYEAVADALNALNASQFAALAVMLGLVSASVGIVASTWLLDHFGIRAIPLLLFVVLLCAIGIVMLVRKIHSAL